MSNIPGSTSTRRTRINVRGYLFEQNGRINYSNLHKIANRVTIIRDSVKCSICPKVFPSMDIMQLHIMTTHGRRSQNETQIVPSNDSRQITNGSRHVQNGGQHVSNDGRHVPNESRPVPNESRHVPNDNRPVTNGNRHFQNESRHSQNGQLHFHNEGMNFQNEGPHFQNNVNHFHADVRQFQNGMSTNLASAGTSSQSSSQEQGNSFQAYSNEMRMIYDQPFIGGHNFCTFRSRQIEYLTPTMKELNPKEGLPLQMVPADLSKKDDITVFQNVCKKMKMDQPNISPSSSPYGLYSQVQTCICPCCSATLPNFQIFMRHMETHIAQSNNSTMSVCPTCGETTKDFESFTNHVFGHCIVQAQGICCGSCKLNFENAEELQKHHHESHVSTVFRCMLCNEILENRMSLQMHFSSKHCEECHHSKCTLCPDLVFHDKTSAEVHVSINHFNQYFQNSNSDDQYSVTNQPRETSERYSERNYKLKCSLFSTELDESPGHMSHLVDEHPEEVQKEKKFLSENSTYQQLPPSMSPNILFSSDPTENMKRYERTPPKSFSCDLCHLTDIPTEIDLLNHKRLQHMKTKIRIVSLNCAYCQEICKSRNDLETHMRGHEMMCGKRKCKCNICDAIYPSAILLAEHKLSHCKIVEGNNCVQCKSILIDEQSYYNHTLLHSTNHVKSNPQITLPANCVICCQTLQNSIELNLHATFHLKHLMKRYLCSICNDTFDNNGQNGENENIVFNLFLGVCQKCATESDARLPCKRKSDDTDSESTLNNKSAESRQIYLANEKNNLECRLCKLMFTSAVKLQIHLIEHNFFGMNQYSCYLCSSVFTGASGLRNHMLEHGLQSRPYECNYCQMKFFFRSELDNHLVVHNSSPKIVTPMPIFNEPASSTDMNDVTQYEACPYCYNLYLKTVFFSEHVKNCSLKPEMKKVQIIEIDNNDKKENFQSIETSDK
ncbi:hypothetical protein WA026_004617 [Henosepilachna vigintioctopunctata]|uniref:C2H2-type domain-containing protein n=1 Tax=Henosepilachna vigintioctopunctata TaxID=420089 RepID=A0AAW1V2N2_9CUCU